MEAQSSDVRTPWWRVCQNLARTAQTLQLRRIKSFSKSFSKSFKFFKSFKSLGQKSCCSCGASLGLNESTRLGRSKGWRGHGSEAQPGTSPVFCQGQSASSVRRADVPTCRRVEKPKLVPVPLRSASEKPPCSPSWTLPR